MNGRATTCRLVGVGAGVHPCAPRLGASGVGCAEGGRRGDAFPERSRDGLAARRGFDGQGGARVALPVPAGPQSPAGGNRGGTRIVRSRARSWRPQCAARAPWARASLHRVWVRAGRGEVVGVMSTQKGTPPSPRATGAGLSVEERRARNRMTFDRVRWVNLPHAADCRCTACAAALEPVVPAPSEFLELARRLREGAA